MQPCYVINHLQVCLPHLTDGICRGKTEILLTRMLNTLTSAWPHSHDLCPGLQL